MTLKAPAFWYRNKDAPAPLSERLLSPLSCLYNAGHKAHQSLGTARSVNIPVLCIGNLVTGGAGKTITAQSLMAMVQSETLAQNPFFLTRGYGGHKKGAFEIEAGKHDYYDCGDESLLLARDARTIISKDRYAGALHAEKLGADLIIMDDGLQNPSLKKDINIIVISGDMGFGNGKLLPAGPLREPLESGLRKADAFVLIGEDRRGVSALLGGKPVFQAQFSTNQDNLPPKDKPYIAFAGIGYPQKFFSHLKGMGYSLAEEISYGDHYPYQDKDIAELKTRAKKTGAELITTEKDFVRLPGSLDFKVNTIPAALSWKNQADMLEFLRTNLKQNKLMKTIRYALEAALLYTLFFIFKIMPVEMASNIGGWLGRMIGPRMAASRKALRNIQRALPELSPEQHSAAIKEMWDNLGRIMAEFSHLQHITSNNVEIKGRENMAPLFEKEQCNILFGAHMSNWEIIGTSVFKHFGHEMDMTYRAPNNPWSGKLLFKIRTMNGQLKAYSKSRQGGRGMLEAARQNRHLGILIDQKYNEGVPAPFFGVPAMTNPVFVQIAQKYNAPLVPVRNERLGGPHFRLTFYEPISALDDAGSPLAVEDVIAKAHAHLESWIREQPGQWLWLHRRWDSDKLKEDD